MHLIQRFRQKHVSGSATVYRRIIGWFPTLLGFTGLAVSFLIRDDNFRYTLRFSVQGLSIFILILYLYYWRVLGFAFTILEWKPLAFIGITSYALYLWHVPMIDMMERGFGDNLAVKTIAVVLSFGLAVFSFNYVEKPFIALRRKFGSHVPEDNTQPVKGISPARIKTALGQR